MLHLGLLCSEESSYGQQLQQCAQARGHHVRYLAFDQLASHIGTASAGAACGTFRLTDFDAVIVRTMPIGSLEQVVFRMNVLAQAEAAGVLILNSARSLECAIDKYLSTCRLRDRGLPVPETIVCEQAEQSLAAFEQLGGDVVVKPLFGSEGRGMIRVCEPDLAVRVFRTLEQLQSVAYIQRFIDHPGFDLRILVLDGQPLGAVIRRAPAGDFRTNVSRNGRPEAAAPEEHLLRMAVEAADAVGTIFAGIDLIQDRDGRWYVLEANGVPGWNGFQHATGIDVAAKLIDFIEGSCNNRILTGEIERAVGHGER